jgi:uncharacterized protein YndB with AHSA1/START domain
VSNEDASFRIDRIVSIRARRATVFRYFTDSERFAAWWGAGSSIEAKPGGKVEIQYPNGVTAGGEVIEVVPNERIVFTYGYDDPAKPIVRGGSRVSITLEDDRGGTLVRLVHHVDTAVARDSHVPGWRFQLSVFANVVANEIVPDVTVLVDRFFALWSEPDASVRASTLDELVTDDISFRDAFASIAGRVDLAAHIEASRMHMPGVTLARDGTPLYCQGTALVDWTAAGPNGTSIGRGTNCIELAEGRIAGVTGFRRAP